MAEALIFLHLFARSPAIPKAEQPFGVGRSVSQRLLPDSNAHATAVATDRLQKKPGALPVGPASEDATGLGEIPYGVPRKQRGVSLANCQLMSSTFPIPRAELQ